MKKRRALPVGLLLCLLMPSFITAQQVPATTAELHSLPVYVVDFKQSEPIREIQDLGAFATGLIDLRLLEIPSLTVHRVAEVPSCETPASSNAGPSQMASTAAMPDNYYVVRGSLEVRLPQIVLDYFVEQCENRAVRTVLQDTQPFTIDHAREQLTVAAHAIAYKIERSTPPMPVTVELFKVEGDAPDSSIPKTIQREVAQVLSKSSSLEVTDNSDYKIGGKVTFQKNSSLFRPFAKTTFQAELHIDAHSTTYPISTIGGSSDALPQFYSQIAAEAQRFLPQVLLAEHLGLPEIQGNMKVDELQAKATQLLAQCSPGAGACTTAQDAIPLLVAATQQSKMWKTFSLLGQAQLLAWKYPDAVASLEMASKLAKQDADAGKHIEPSDRAQILTQLGDAYRNIEKYTQASTAYDQSLSTLPSQPELYAKKGLALRLGGDRLASLQVILAGIKAYPDHAKPLGDQARDVIKVLQKDEFDKAENLFADASRAGLPVSNEYAFVLAQKWDQILDTSTAAEARAEARKVLTPALSLQPLDPDIQADLSLNLARAELYDGDRAKLRSLVASIGKLPTDQATAGRREWALRISSQDHTNYGEYEAAAADADEALRIMASDSGSYLAATARLFLAQQKEQAAGSSPTSEQQSAVKKLYRETADIAAPLVLKRYSDIDNVFVMANHPLGEDRKTQEQFERLLKINPNDVGALNALMFVCSQYLLDARCAFSTAQKLAALENRHGPEASSDYLNIAEVAVLTSNNDVALDWIKSAAQQPQLSPRNESLVYFYRLWVEIRRGQAQESAADFQAWRGAVQRFRQTHEQLNWIFDGVKKLLSQEKLAGGGSILLREMTEALEDNNKPLPTWPRLSSATLSHPN